MRLFMTEIGREAWFAALMRNVRMEITRFEIGALDVFSLSGYKQSGRTVQQFRTLGYLPDWVPDFNELLTNDTVVFNGTPADIGYWRVRNNEGGLVLRVPASAADMQIGNVRIYAKNTGPYPYATMQAQAYKQYQEVYSDSQGGEILLFAGFASIAEDHWQAPTEFPSFTDIRLAIYADGLFNNIDRTALAFERAVDVLEVENEHFLTKNVADGYHTAVVRSHTRTGRPVIAYRSHGSDQWFGYPLHNTYTAPLEEELPIADYNIDNNILDYGVLNPAPPTDDSNLTVINSQPRKLAMFDMSFTKKDVGSWTQTTAVQTLSLLPDTTRTYMATVKVADFAFLGTNQELVFVHNGARYSLCAQGKARNTPLLAFKHSDVMYIEATLHGPISSLTGMVYAELNEAPITNDVNNTFTWLLGKVSVHLTSTVAVTPTRLNYGLTGRRTGPVNWLEFTPEQYVTGLGRDMYGNSPTVPLTIRVKPTAGGAAGTGASYGTQQADVSNPSYDEFRRGVQGLTGTSIKVYRNGVDAGTISTPSTPEGSVTINVQENDRLSFRLQMVGNADNLPSISAEVEGVTTEGFTWLAAKFDLAATYGPDTVPPTPVVLPTVGVPAPIANLVGRNSFSDFSSPTHIINKTVAGNPTLLAPLTVTSEWFTLMAAPNPTTDIVDATIQTTDLVVSGANFNGFTITLEKYDPWNSLTSYVLATEAGVVPTGDFTVDATDITIDDTDITVDTTDTGTGTGSSILVTIPPATVYRIKITYKDPGIGITAKIKFATDFGIKEMLINSAVIGSV